MYRKERISDRCKIFIGPFARLWIAGNVIKGKEKVVFFVQFQGQLDFDFVIELWTFVVIGNRTDAFSAEPFAVAFSIKDLQLSRIFTKQRTLSPSPPMVVSDSKYCTLIAMFLPGTLPPLLLRLTDSGKR